MKLFARFGPHVLVWGLMFAYFIFAPDVFARFFARHGKPIQINNTLPAESGRIHFLVEGLVPVIKDGEELYELYGWALMVPENSLRAATAGRELVLISEAGNYYFPVDSTARNPELPEELAGVDVDRQTLGFRVLLFEDTIRPGEYRVGMVFRDPATGSAFYSDKPATYLVKTPNTLTWRRK
jgi:hypothetical protein